MGFTVAYKITDIYKDVPILNKALADLDKVIEAQNQQLQQNHLMQQQFALITQNAAKGVTASNNAVFTWTGSTSTISWAACYVHDSLDNYYPIPAGSQAGLAPSTAYWAGWNPAQQIMSFQTNIDTLLAIRNILILSHIQTGTAAGSGSVGGGGTDPGGSGGGGKQYF